jgi:hypothetical protein
MTWDYDGIDAIYLSSEEERKYHVDIVQLLENLLYKEILMTFDVNTNCVINEEWVFIVWDHNGVNVKRWCECQTSPMHVWRCIWFGCHKYV